MQTSCNARQSTGSAGAGRGGVIRGVHSGQSGPHRFVSRWTSLGLVWLTGTVATYDVYLLGTHFPK